MSEAPEGTTADETATGTEVEQTEATDADSVQDAPEAGE